MCTQERATPSPWRWRAQYSTVQYSTVQYSTVQYSTARTRPSSHVAEAGVAARLQPVVEAGTKDAAVSG